MQDELKKKKKGYAFIIRPWPHVIWEHLGLPVQRLCSPGWPGKVRKMKKVHVGSVHRKNREVAI